MNTLYSPTGRFGDMLIPWSDIITIARTLCVTKDGGYLTIGVPYDVDNEYIRFNGDRSYGKIRYPYLTTNRKQFYIGWGVHKVRAMVIISLHGISISPNLPKPECSTELNITMASIFSSLFSKQSMPVWTVETVNKMIQLAKQEILEGTYGRNDTNSLRDGL
jgi:hypothetical protein